MAQDHLQNNHPSIEKMIKSAVAIEFLFLIVVLVIIVKEVVQLIKKI